MKKTNKSQRGFCGEATFFPKAFFPTGKKGFLGPIGDDLPSLIPLLFALMIFFYVFTFTWNIFDQRQRVFNDAIETLKLGDTLKGNSYIAGKEAFDVRCLEAQSVKRIKFISGLLPLSTGPGQTFGGLQFETLETDSFGEGQFFCTNAGEERPDETSTGLIIRSFPVALEFKNPETGSFYVRPMLSVVVTWR